MCELPSIHALFQLNAWYNKTQIRLKMLRLFEVVCHIFYALIKVNVHCALIVLLCFSRRLNHFVMNINSPANGFQTILYKFY